MTKKSEFPVTAVRWHSIFVALIALALMFFSCGGDGNGDGDSSSSVAVLSSSSDCPAGIQLCVGTGSDTARLFIQWNDGLPSNPMVWIYRFNSGDSVPVTGIDMIFAIAKADSKFAALVSYDSTIDTTGGPGDGKPFGWAVGGLGYFFSGARQLLFSATQPPDTVSADSNGLFIADSAALFDYYTKLTFPPPLLNNHWASGWFTAGFWNYQVNTAPYTSNTLNTNDFTWSMEGASTRVLANDSADYYEWSPPYVPPSSSSNGGDPSSSSNGEDLSSSSSEETSASAKINPNLIHPANRNIRIK